MTDQDYIELPNPTGGEEGLFVPCGEAWDEIVRQFDAPPQVTRHYSPLHGHIDFLTGFMNGAVHLAAQVRTTPKGQPVEAGWIWTEDGLQRDLMGINDRVEMAAAILFFGLIGHGVLTDSPRKPLDAPQPSSGMMAPKKTRKHHRASLAP